MVSLGEIEVNLPFETLKFDDDQAHHVYSSYLGTDRNGELRYSLQVAVQRDSRISIRILPLKGNHSDGVIKTFIREAMKVDAVDDASTYVGDVQPSQTESTIIVPTLEGVLTDRSQSDVVRELEDESLADIVISKINDPQVTHTINLQPEPVASHPVLGTCSTQYQSYSSLCSLTDQPTKSSSGDDSSHEAELEQSAINTELIKVKIEVSHDDDSDGDRLFSHTNEEDLTSNSRKFKDATRKRKGTKKNTVIKGSEENKKKTSNERTKRFRQRLKLNKERSQTLISNVAGANKTKSRNDLTLKMKYEVIKKSELEPNISRRKLSEMFKCGKTQIGTILKNKKNIKETYEGSNSASYAVCQSKRTRISQYSDINETLLQWYQQAVSRGLFPDGKLLCERAMYIAKELDNKEFKASNGWLHRFKIKHNIKKMTI